MGRPDLSIVIPTRDRRETLLDTLAALGRQDTGGRAFEVVVVDDGSSDGSGEAVEAGDVGPAEVAVVRQPRSGPAAARNRGVAAASGDRVLLLGDDTVPTPGAVAAHLDGAAAEGFAIQGRIEWDPGQEITRVMRFLAPAGPQFYFAGLDDGRTVPYTAVLGSNLSASRQWFLDDPFDEGYTEACMEDTELAYRWWRRRRLAVYSERAVCLHHHVYREIGPFLRRQVRAGRWAKRMTRQHPATLPRVAIQPVAFGIVVLARALLRTAVLRPCREDLWDLRWRLAFARGFLLGR